MIDGVVVKEVVTHTDERGFFREVIRATDALFDGAFGQLSHSLVYPGVVKAWHGHRSQSQWTYVASGLLKVVIHDLRAGSSTSGAAMEFLSGDHRACVYRLPPGVVHGYRCLAGPAHVIYVTTGTYAPDDELRLPHDEATIGYDWLNPRVT